MIRRVYIQISEEWLKRLEAVADAERREPRVQATCILEMGIVQLEKEYGLADPDQPPRVIEGISTPSFKDAKNGAVVRKNLDSAVLT